MLNRLSPQRRRFALSAILLVLIAVVAGAAAIVASGGGGGRSGAAGPVPILVLPGYGGTASGVAQLATALRSTGRPVTVVELPEDGKGPIAASALALDEAVSALDVDQVDLVGHSAGGVVIRFWAARLDDRRVARRIVALGSPHHGTTLADALGAFSAADCAGACADLRPGSQALKELNAGDETPGNAAWTTIWTAADETVLPPESARLAGATDVRLQDLCPNASVTHGGLVRDPLPLEITLAAVEARAPVFSC